ERSVLPARIESYDRSMLDTLCLTGEVGWGRLSTIAGAPELTRLGGSTPIALFLREHGERWHSLRFADHGAANTLEGAIGPAAQRTLDALRSRGASFAHELATAAALDVS